MIVVYNSCNCCPEHCTCPRVFPETKFLPHITYRGRTALQRGSLNHCKRKETAADFSMLLWLVVWLSASMNREGSVGIATGQPVFDPPQSEEFFYFANYPDRL
jgi:hypothetical protein